MISRRTLFARLSAVALAPLAKVLGGTPATKTVTVFDPQGNTAKVTTDIDAFNKAYARKFDESVKALEEYLWGECRLPEKV